MIEKWTGERGRMTIQFATQEADCLFTDFNHMPFSLRKLKKAFSSWQDGLEGKGWNMLYMENHDHPRIVSRYGSEKFRTESAKMLATLYLFLKGTPFIYQGQEIGMRNWYPNDPEMDENSVLNFYRKAIRLRKELSCVRYGNYIEYGKNSSKFYTYAREDENQKILVVCSFSDKVETWTGDDKSRRGIPSDN